MGESAVMDRPAGGIEDDGLPPVEDELGTGGEEPSGEAPADLPGDDVGGDDPQPAAGIILDGDFQLSLTIGGKKPTSSTLKLKGGTLDLEGEFRKGDRLRVVLDLRVGAVKIEDTVDSNSGEVKSTKRTQWATIEGAQRVGLAAGESEE